MRLLGVAILIAAAVMAGCSGGGKSGAVSPAAQSGMPVIDVGITNGANAVYTVSAEVATTAQQHETGLMNRASLGADAGMLFVFGDEQVRYFWMKNTLISLDIIYIGADKKIINIVENAVPLSTTPLGSAAPAKYVLEVNGGYCSSKNIRSGDVVSFSGY